MRKSLYAVAVTAALSIPSLVMAADAAPAPSPFTGNVGFATEYLYRGIAQTAGKPALQGGFDYAHASGAYVGVWGSNISWLENAVTSSASLEVDIYGGYKGAMGDLGYDVGILTYNYPGSLVPGKVSPNTTELYGAMTWKILTVKYSQSTTNLFGVADSKRSGYLELNAAYDLGDGWGVTAHVGKQKVKNSPLANYTDYKLGVTKDVGVGVVSLAVSTTNANDNCSSGDFYCVPTRPDLVLTPNYSAGKSRVVLSFNKTF
jgi:uncharacterized protein (TIGR02001 family)